ncbi:MAG: ATP-binding protein [Roseburia sp.]|nr:ATP-binding protein [Roseburia sp.]MCM1097229.1 ATP-binding protein [Ruminococcus flavefaciens]
MLIQFNFKNFKSFRDEVSLDLSATKITEHENHVAEAANDRLLKVAAIYGANASGKSNVYDAFEYMTYYVGESFKFGEETERRRKTEDGYLKVTPFLFDEKSRKEETMFEVFYVDSSEDTGKIYQYGFSLKEDEVVEEWLYSKAKTARNKYRTIFYRKKGEELEMNGFSKNHVENIKASLNKESLIVSLGSKLRIAKLKKVRDWFLSNEIVNFGDPAENFFLSRVLPDGFAEKKEVQKNVVDYFASFDEAIVDFNIEELPQEDEKSKSYQIDALHKMGDSGETASIPLKQESSGTLKMFALYPSLKEVLDHGTTLFIDELNARLHPLLARNIILTFLSPEINTKNAQLVFTTHDVWQFSNELLRRDEIWMVNKNRDGISELYSLVEFRDEEGNKVHRNEPIAKNYLTGNYGAIPALKPMNMLKGRAVDGK